VHGGDHLYHGHGHSHYSEVEHYHHAEPSEPHFHHTQLEQCFDHDKSGYQEHTQPEQCFHQEEAGYQGQHEALFHGQHEPQFQEQQEGQHFSQQQEGRFPEVQYAAAHTPRRADCGSRQQHADISHMHSPHLSVSHPQPLLAQAASPTHSEGFTSRAYFHVRTCPAPHCLGILCLAYTCRCPP
jgi:hypothetical protein